MSRGPLILLQVLGGLSLLAFPYFGLTFILAAPKGHPLRALPYLATLLYPVVWIGLWVLSWRLFRRGEFTNAYVMSSIPVLLSAVMTLVSVLLMRRLR